MSTEGQKIIIILDPPWELSTRVLTLLAYSHCLPCHAFILINNNNNNTRFVKRRVAVALEAP